MGEFIFDNQTLKIYICNSGGTVVGQLLIDDNKHLMVDGIKLVPINQIHLGAKHTDIVYGLLGRKIFFGTNVVGTPTNIKIIGEKSSGATSGSVRIVDITNGGVIICELTNITDGSPTIIDLGAITNLSTGEAVWEIQAKRVGGDSSDYMAVDTISIIY